MDKKDPKTNLEWQVLNKRIDRSYNLYSVQINTSKSPSTGKTHEFQVLTSPEWVTVIALTPENKMVLVNQYRHGSGTLSLEPPGGLAKDGVSLEQSAREELEEETAYQAPEFEYVGWMYPVPAIFTNKFHVYLARNAQPTGKIHPDETEDIETMLLTINEVKDYIRTGKINCSVMIAAIYLFLARCGDSPARG